VGEYSDTSTKKDKFSIGVIEKGLKEATARIME
jgi:hypothetical protein